MLSSSNSSIHPATPPSSTLDKTAKQATTTRRLVSFDENTRVGGDPIEISDEMRDLARQANTHQLVNIIYERASGAVGPTQVLPTSQTAGLEVVKFILQMILVYELDALGLIENVDDFTRLIQEEEDVEGDVVELSRMLGMYGFEYTDMDICERGLEKICESPKRISLPFKPNSIDAVEEYRQDILTIRQEFCNPELPHDIVQQICKFLGAQDLVVYQSIFPSQDFESAFAHIVQRKFVHNEDNIHCLMLLLYGVHFKRRYHHFQAWRESYAVRGCPRNLYWIAALCGERPLFHQSLMSFPLMEFGGMSNAAHARIDSWMESSKNDSDKVNELNELMAPGVLSFPERIAENVASHNSELYLEISRGLTFPVCIAVTKSSPFSVFEKWTKYWQDLAEENKEKHPANAILRVLEEAKNVSMALSNGDEYFHRLRRIARLLGFHEYE